MAVPEIELRVAALEAEVAQLKQQIKVVSEAASPWWQEIYGTFANDSLYEEAMRLGRKYRESLRPKSAKRAPGRSTKPSSIKSSAKPSAKRAANRPAKRATKRRKR